MNPKELLDLLTLEQLDNNLFRGSNQDIGNAAVFGGQLLGQAMAAAGETVDGYDVHSMHAYFLRTGDLTKPIIYDVERVRDGRTFCTRRVVAIQNGKRIFFLSASFQKTEEGFSHQVEMPKVPSPEELPCESGLRLSMAETLPPERRDFYTIMRPVEMRPIYPDDLWEHSDKPAEQGFWIRINTQLPNSSMLHRALLAYTSDYYFMGTALRPHGVRFSTHNLMVTSLDHAMWFHQEFRMDEWILYMMDSPASSNARGLNFGKFYRRDGTLVASCVQEGLSRIKNEG